MSASTSTTILPSTPLPPRPLLPLSPSPSSSPHPPVQDGCLPDGSSPFGNGALWLMHNGEGAEVPLCAQPPVVPGTRRGGTDAANAATWRFVPAAEGGGGGTELFHLAAFDRPGHLLSLDEGGTVRLLPRPADGPPPATQAWRRTPCPTGSGEGEGEGGSVHLESAARPGQYLALVRQADASGPSRVLVHGPPAVASRQWRLGLAGVERAAAVQVEQGFAQYAAASFWARAPPGSGGGGGGDSAPGATRSSYLLMPLNELVDEHYTVYLCRHNATGAAVRKLPSFCL